MRTDVLLLFLCFLGSMGVGLVFPLFPVMIFGDGSLFFDPSTTVAIKGFWFGFLLAVMPLTQVVASPLVGSLSDRYGRRKIIVVANFLGTIGYFLSAWGVWYSLLFAVLCSRIAVGIAGATYATINASFVDITPEKLRPRRFAWTSMAFGAGLIAGPAFGGILASETLFWNESYVRPFLVAGVVLFVSTILAVLCLPETKKTISPRTKTPIPVPVRYVLLVSFLFCFGWSLYHEFISVRWIHLFAFSSKEIGLFSAFGACWYVFFCATTSGSIMQKFSQVTVFQVALLILALLFLAALFISNTTGFLIAILLQNFFATLVFPTLSTIVSQHAAAHQQGRFLGFVYAAETLGIGVSVLVSGPLIGIHELLPIGIAGTAVLSSAFVAFALARSKSY